MSRKAEVHFFERRAGLLLEDDEGYLFKYDEEYLNRRHAGAISFSLPLRPEPYREKQLHSFFDGLIPEGWMLSIAEQTWKLNPRDRMGLLLACCRDCIGAVSIIPLEGSDEE